MFTVVSEEQLFMLCENIKNQNKTARRAKKHSEKKDVTPEQKNTCVFKKKHHRGVVQEEEDALLFKKKKTFWCSERQPLFFSECFFGNEPFSNQKTVCFRRIPKEEPLLSGIRFSKEGLPLRRIPRTAAFCCSKEEEEDVLVFLSLP